MTALCVVVSKDHYAQGFLFGAKVGRYISETEMIKAISTVDRLFAEGATKADALKEAGISGPTYYRAKESRPSVSFTTLPEKSRKPYGTSPKKPSAARLAVVIGSVQEVRSFLNEYL